MIKSLFIVRLKNQLPLSEWMESPNLTKQFPDLKSQKDAIIKSASLQQKRCSVESGGFTFHYKINNGIIYLCITDKSFSKQLAAQYLDEIDREFYSKYGDDVEKVQRPYAFLQFDLLVKKKNTNYRDSKVQHNLKKLNDELGHVTKIVTQNIRDIMERGENLDRLGTMSSRLSKMSRDYSKHTEKLNTTSLYDRYWSYIMVMMVFGFIYLWWRYV